MAQPLPNSARQTTHEEIGSWYRMSEDERLRIMAELPERMRQAFALEQSLTPEPDKAE